MKHLKFKSGLSIVLACTILATFSIPAMAAEPNTEKEEVVYINLEKDGSVNEINVVNIPVSYTHLDVYKRQGLDAVTTDQVNEILEHSNKLYTLLKIDEINNLGAVRIRIRSLIAAMRMRSKEHIKPNPQPVAYHRAEYSAEMQAQGYTILAPQMSPIHFDILEPVFKKHGYHVVILDNDNRTAIDTGLKYVNNDACYPSITVVGQIMEAVLSGRYDTNRLAIAMTQTGGCCRASNYVAFIRRALDKAGLSYIPVISLNANGMEKNAGFQWSAGLLMDAAPVSYTHLDVYKRQLLHNEI